MPWFTDAEDGRRNYRHGKDEERSFTRCRGFWLTATREVACALLRRAVGSNVVVETDAQVEVRAFELRRKRLERTRGANRGSCGGIERLFARGPINAEAVGGKTSIFIDAERNCDDSLVPQVKGFRHHRDPILLQLGEQPIDVTLEIHSLSGSKNRDADCPPARRLLRGLHGHRRFRRHQKLYSLKCRCRRRGHA